MSSKYTGDITRSENFSNTGIGEYLRSARLSAGLDVRQLAKKLHLTRDVVESIEEENFEYLPARVFVRGYVINYARHTGLRVEVALEKFDIFWPKNKRDPVIAQLPKPSYDPFATKKWKSIITSILIILAAIISVSLYLDSKNQELTSEDVNDSIPESTNNIPLSISIPEKDQVVIVQSKKKFKTTKKFEIIS